MVDRNTVVFGILIVLAFIWRFARTRQIYLVSLDVQTGGSEAIPFRPYDLRSFVSQALLGHRSLNPTSFFIRGFVFLVVAVGLIPFKDYEPPLYLLFVVLIVLYVPWCIAHGLMLKKNIPDDGAN
jgi:hypothetical protein